METKQKAETEKNQKESEKKEFNLKNIIKDNLVYFHFFRNNIAFYKVKFNEEFYQFPVPLEDIGDATLLDKDKAIMFMRYIRKAITNKEFVKAC